MMGPAGGVRGPWWHDTFAIIESPFFVSGGQFQRWTKASTEAKKAASRDAGPGQFSDSGLWHTQLRESSYNAFVKLCLARIFQ